MKELLKTYNGKPWGWIETLPNGDVECRDWHGRVVGWYRKSRNVTTDFNGRIIARGNVVTILLPLPDLK